VLDQRGVTLFDDALWAFYQEHEYCRDLDGGVGGDRVWMTCSCGVCWCASWRSARLLRSRPQTEVSMRLIGLAVVFTLSMIPPRTGRTR
jgi:hypothetical protein